MLGVPAEFGRVFDGTEDPAVGAAPVVTISEGYWRRRFAADRLAIGRDIVINGVKCTIIGVAAAGFGGDIVGVETDVWIPLSMQPLMMRHTPMLRDRNRTGCSSWAG